MQRVIVVNQHKPQQQGRAEALDQCGAGAKLENFVSSAEISNLELLLQGIGIH